jgi:CHAT domain-containing protein/tetratricopeptide (TPR) repeat protein
LNRPFDQHLDGNELDALASSRATGVTSSGRISEQAIRGAQLHTESCEDCHRKVQMHESVQGEILRLRTSGSVRPGTGCIDDPDWVRVVAGLLPEGETSELINHAAQCGRCGPLLKAAAEILSDDTTPAEESLVASLSSARLEWQGRMAETLRSSTEPPQTKDRYTWRLRVPFSWARPAFALAAVALVVVAGWLGVRILNPLSADQLLAQAYTDRRTLAVRIPGAKYARQAVERGAGGSSLDRPASLLKAEALIGENLQKHPNDPRWIQAKARADLLDGNYDSAIKTLQRALEAQPDSPQLLTDLGSAYFVRAESANRAIDYGNAVEALGKALAKAPDDPIALFNRALACERIFLYTQAVEDWEHYLRIDPKGEWAAEARKRLAAVQEKAKQHAERISEPLLTPAEIAKRQNDQAVLDSIEERVEDYLNVAIQEWLPSAFPTVERPLNDETAKTRLALQTLATILTSGHQDEWLADILSASDSRDMAIGLQGLSMASKDNAAGDPEAAEVQAQKAETFFRRASSAPGVWRAQFEEIYASQRRFQSEACLLAVARLREQTNYRKLAFISIQLHLEHYACLTSADVLFDKATDSLVSALALSKEAHYPILYLRALGFSASEQTEKGDAEAAWELDRAGLDDYWIGSAGPRRASQFYDDMGVSAQESGEWFLSVALGREAVVAISATADRSAEGMERLELASSASQAHLWQQAADEYSRALGSFARLPDDESVRAFEGSSEVGLAEAAIAQGRFQDAESHLLSARSKLPPNFQEYETWLFFYRTLAALRRNTGDITGAEAACASAIQVAEMGLYGISDELGRLRWNRATSDCYREMVDFRLRSGDTVAALEFWEWYRSSGTRSRAPTIVKNARFSDLEHQTNFPRLHAVEDQLAALKGETVIAYADLRGHTIAWGYDDRGIVWRSINIPTGFKHIVARFGEECRDPNSDLASLRRDGHTIFDVLLAPFWERLDVRRTLVVETDGVASLVPFAALVDADGKYVSERYRISYLPALGYRGVLRPTKPIKAQDEAIVVGSPTLGPDQGSYSALPDADREAEEVAREFAHAIYLPGQEATLDAVLAVLPRSAVFHFAGHSVTKPGHAGLLLAQQASSRSVVLDSESLAKARPQRLKLAVLSACSTNQDDDEATRGAGSIARAFLRTGVPDVVATRWPIDSSSTAILMHTLYRELLRGNTVAEALRLSMFQMHTTSQYAHPYYWAAFEAFGRGADEDSSETVLAGNRRMPSHESKGIPAANSSSDK